MEFQLEKDIIGKIPFLYNDKIIGNFPYQKTKLAKEYFDNKDNHIYKSFFLTYISTGKIIECFNNFLFAYESPKF